MHLHTEGGVEHLFLSLIVFLWNSPLAKSVRPKSNENGDFRLSSHLCGNKLPP